MEDNNAVEAPTPCTAGCGFYGSKIYNNMCSKCFKEQEDRNKNVEQVDMKMDKKPLFTKAFIHEPTAVVEEVVKVEEKEEEPPTTTTTTIVQKNKGRCFSCRVKIPLAKQLTNKCRCEYVFCDTHRYPDKHDCNFDHAKKDKEILLKNNPKLHDKPRGGNSFNRLDSM